MLDCVYGNNEDLIDKGLDNVIKAMEIVDRKFFVPETMLDECYLDAPLEIGQGQTISQPSTVARMLLLSELKPRLDVLEVGAGSGWNACLAARLVYPGHVLAIERIKWLSKNARKNIAKFKQHLEKQNSKEANKFKNLLVETADALDEKSAIRQKKYDRIIITAGIYDDKTDMKIEKMATQTLNHGGILLAPRIYPHIDGDYGPLKLYRKNKLLKKEETKENYRFVPLLPGTI
jgi:protein-L-isoaspartate(D-aspartate) O-methyltransferase